MVEFWGPCGPTMIIDGEYYRSTGGMEKLSRDEIAETECFFERIENKLKGINQN